MRRLRLVLAVAAAAGILGAVSSPARAQDTGGLTPEAKAAFAWFDTLGMTALRLDSWVEGEGPELLVGFLCRAGGREGIQALQDRLPKLPAATRSDAISEVGRCLRAAIAPGARPAAGWHRPGGHRRRV